MTGLRSLFDEEQNEMLKDIGVDLSDDKDYTDDELIDIYDTITSHYQVAAFDKDGEPLPICYAWESIIDTFFDNTE